MTDETYLRLSEAVAALTQQRDQAAGAAAELERQLLEEFGFRTLAEARAELTRLGPAATKADAAADAEHARLVEKWGDRLK